MPAYRPIAFDAYSALFDRDRSLVPVLAKALGASADAAAAIACSIRPTRRISRFPT